MAPLRKTGHAAGPPGMVDILANIQKGPLEKRTRTEILNDLGGLVRDHGRVLRLDGLERSASLMD